MEHKRISTLVCLSWWGRCDMMHVPSILAGSTRVFTYNYPVGLTKLSL